MRFTILSLAACLFLHPLSFAAEKPETEKKEAEQKVEHSEQEPVVVEGSVTIGGSKIDYETITDKLTLKKDDGTPRASIFHVTYLRKGVEDTSTRPVLFAFNGGPGSSAVWLHLGILGPVRVSLPGDGTTAPKPPAKLVPNEFSILDVADLVFVDPVSTGYSRTEKGGKPDEFHGVRQDVTSLGDFVRRWVSENDRWSSPKYLLGESYGGIRVAGLSEHLQSRYGMSLNGVVLLSSLLDFRTLRPGDGDPLLYMVYLPTYTAVAHYHGKIQGDRDTLVAQAQEFALGEYALALLKGTNLTGDQRDKIAARLSELTSLDKEAILKDDLRIDPTSFRSSLLADEDKVIGRFDARVAWPANEGSAAYAAYDPSFSLAFGAYSTAMLSYLTEELGWEEHVPYEILSSKVHPWKWTGENEISNLTSALARAMRDNPHLKVLVMKGAADLATPPGGIDYSLSQMLSTPDSARERIHHADYEAGHMFYLNPPDLEKSRADLLQFLQDTP